MKAIYTEKTIGFGFSENTANEYDNQITYDTLAARLAIISDAVQQNSDCICYIVGMGAHPRSTYQEIAKINGAEVIWYSSTLPKPLRFLKGIVASYAGLVKINNSAIIEKIFMELIDSSMAGIYLIPPYYELKFLENIRGNLPPLSYDFGIKCCKSYFMYVVDADNAESKTGIYELISYGVEALPDLVRVFENK